MCVAEVLQAFIGIIQKMVSGVLKIVHTSEFYIKNARRYLLESTAGCFCVQGYSDFWKAGNGWCHCYKEAYACSTKIYLFENIPELKRWD